jgi:hypothetical protein
MSVTVTVTLSTDILGDDYSTQDSQRQIVALTPSPAELWQYELQAGDNYLIIPAAVQAQALWLDPQVGSGATWTLKGVTGDVGVPISSALPSFIPVSSLNAIGATFQADSGAILYAQQYNVVITSSLTTQTQTGWF